MAVTAPVIKGETFGVAVKTTICTQQLLNSRLVWWCLMVTEPDRLFLNDLSSNLRGRTVVVGDISPFHIG